jgi:hypothetical protein
MLYRYFLCASYGYPVQILWIPCTHPMHLFDFWGWEGLVDLLQFPKGERAVPPWGNRETGSRSWVGYSTSGISDIFHLLNPTRPNLSTGVKVS